MAPPPSQPQVIYIVESSPRHSIKEVYMAKKATVLGWIHILCGVVILTAEITSPRLERYFLGTGIWTSIVFFTSGIFAICGARSKNKRLVVATLVMAVISAVSAGVLLILTSVFESPSLCRYYYYSDNDYCSFAALKVTFSLKIMVSLVMLVAAVSSATLTCQPLCCRPFLVPEPAQNTLDTHTQPATAPALLQEDLPPAYNSTKKYPQLQQGHMC